MKTGRYTCAKNYMSLQAGKVYCCEVKIESREIVVVTGENGYCEEFYDSEIDGIMVDCMTEDELSEMCELCTVYVKNHIMRFDNLERQSIGVVRYINPFRVKRVAAAVCEKVVKPYMVLLGSFGIISKLVDKDYEYRTLTVARGEEYNSIKEFKKIQKVVNGVIENVTEAVNNVKTEQDAADVEKALDYVEAFLLGIVGIKSSDGDVTEERIKDEFWGLVGCERKAIECKSSNTGKKKSKLLSLIGRA